MKKMLAALAVSLSIPCVALAATWDNVSLIDQMCAQKEKVTANPDKHLRRRLLKCADSGEDPDERREVHEADAAAGSKMALAELKKTQKKDGIRVNVTGEEKGGRHPGHCAQDRGLSRHRPEGRSPWIGGLGSPWIGLTTRCAPSRGQPVGRRATAGRGSSAPRRRADRRGSAT